MASEIIIAIKSEEITRRIILFLSDVLFAIQIIPFFYDKPDAADEAVISLISE